MALGTSLIGSALLATLLLFVLVWPRRYRGPSASVQVLVLGDVGRSPRMQYHALSIAQHAPVQLIGYFESDLVDELARHPRLTRVPLSPSPAALRQLPFLLGGPLKVLWQVLDLFLVLAYRTRPSAWLLVQNPPSIPTLAVATLTTRLRHTRLLVDWHNYGWSILATTRTAGARHPFVRLSRRYEEVFGRLAGHANLTVTRAMAAQLRSPPYAIPSSTPIAVLHDRPASLFQPAPAAAAADRGRELGRMLQDPTVEILVAGRGAKVLVSSTSWTPDEDFQLLLDALVQYVRDVKPQGAQGDQTPPPTRPPILAVITGKGPQKALYQRKMAELAASGDLPPGEIAIRTAFLPMADYARLLALADLGVCLHMSSSGVDLPMKVVDMFGSGLPVAAYSAYASFGELVREGENGRGFTTSGELAGLLAQLLNPGAKDLERLRVGARQESNLRWGEEWERVVSPIFGFTTGKR